MQDADKLEMLGVFGILRTTATFGTSHKPLFTAAEDEHADDLSNPEAKPTHAVAHMLDRERLLNLMRTSEGKAAGERCCTRGTLI